MKKFILSAVLLTMTMGASAQWNDITVNNQLTAEGVDLYGSDVQSNKDGITYVHYSTPMGGNTVTFLQILDKEGNKTIEGNGILVSDTTSLTWTQVNETMLVDSEGNAILMVSDCRNSSKEEQNLNYSIYKVSPEGKMLWGKDGVDLHRGKSSSLTFCMKAIELEDGSFVFAWSEEIGFAADGSKLTGIKLERLSKDGEFQWDEQLELCSGETTYCYPYLENAGNNQFILVYAEGGNQNIYARKIDFDGSSVWAKDTKVYVGGFGNVPLHLLLKTAYDPNGGVFIGWTDDRYYTDLEKPYISYVQADGTLKFGAGTEALQVGYSEYMRALALDFVYNEEENCVYCLWRGLALSSSVFQSVNIQKVSMDGELVWGAEGGYIEPIDEKIIGYVSIQNAEEGNVAAFYTYTNTAYKDIDIFAIKISPEGNPLWEGGIYEFSPTVGDKGDLHVSPLLNNDHWIVSWTDDRVLQEGSMSVLYAEKVSVNGASSDGIAQTANDQSSFVANVTEGVVNFATKGNEAITITIYSAAGEAVGSVTSTSNTASYSTTGLAAGVYIATMQGEKSAASTRFIVK